MKVAVLGGGVWLVELVDALRELGLPIELWIAARNLERLRQIAAHLPRLASGPVRVAQTIEAAVTDASLIIPMVRVGGSAARAWDETFPNHFGFPGDEGLGLGGLANAWRTVPFMTKLGLMIRERAPKATVLNLVAPLGITTRALGRAYGVCELPALTAAAWGEDPTAPDLHYAGFNHAGWFWPSSARGRDRLAAAVAAGHIDQRTWEETGAAPLKYHWDVTDPSAGARMGRQRRSPGRAQALSIEAAELLHRWAHDPLARPARSMPWFRQALVPALRALVDGTPWHGFACAAQPNGVVEEHRAVWTTAGPTLVHPPRPPRPVAAWIAHQEAWEVSGWEAATSRDVEALRPALHVLGVPRASHEAVLSAITREIS